MFSHLKILPEMIPTVDYNRLFVTYSTCLMGFFACTAFHQHYGWNRRTNGRYSICRINFPLGGMEGMCTVVAKQLKTVRYIKFKEYEAEEEKMVEKEEME